MKGNLNGIVLGNPKTGKTCLLQTLSGKKPLNNQFEVNLTDPISKSTLNFLIEESNEMLDCSHCVCVIITYSMNNRESFRAVQNKWMPQVFKKINHEASFVMVLGTHSDLRSEKKVNTQEAEEFAATNGVFHMEVSVPSKRNIELTLKLMRIRANYILKKHPEVMEALDYVSTKEEASMEDNKLLDSEIDHQVDFEDCATPQFSTKDHKKDFPLQISDLSALVSKRNRYYQESDSKLDKHEGNLSFANISGISNCEEEEAITEDIFNEELDGEPRTEREVNIDTLGSPMFWDRKVPPLSSIPLNVEKQTPRTQQRRISSSFQFESENSTERSGNEALLHLEINLGYEIKHVDVFEGDSAFDLAKKVLNNAPTKQVNELTQLIQEKVSNYCEEVKKVQTKKKALYKVKVNLGNKSAEVVVRKGDKPSDLAKKFAKENNLSKDLEKEVLKMLLSAEDSRKTKC